MRKAALPFIFAAMFAAAVPAAAWADFARGKQAYDKKNYKTALAELNTEARRGNLVAMHLLGTMYADGLGVERDDKRAFEWFEKAAQGNYAPSQGMLGMFYAGGRGIIRDNGKSMEWARRAAENGDALSQYMMGVRSLDGLGVPRSPTDAIFWFGSAAEQNYALAQYALGVLVGFGPEAQADTPQAREYRTEAAKWLMLAIRQKSRELPNAQVKLDELKKRMQKKDLSEADARVRKWRPVAGKKPDMGSLTQPPGQAAAANKP